MVDEWKPHPRQIEFSKLITSDTPIRIGQGLRYNQNRRAAILNIGIEKFQELGLIEVKETVPGMKKIYFKTYDPKTRRYLQKWFDSAPYL